MRTLINSLVSTLFIIALFVFVTTASAILFPSVGVELLFYFVLTIVTGAIIAKEPKEKE